MDKPTSRAAWSPAEFAQRWGLGRSTLYRLMAEGKIKGIKIGSKTLITAEAEREWLDAAPAWRPISEGNPAPAPNP